LGRTCPTNQRDCSRSDPGSSPLRHLHRSLIGGIARGRKRSPAPENCEVAGVLQVGQPLLIRNSDDTLHNVHALTGGRTGHSPADTPMQVMNCMLTILLDPERLRDHFSRRLPP
jgi:hypothetical protein